MKIVLRLYTSVDDFQRFSDGTTMSGTTVVTARIDAALRTRFEALARSTRRSKAYLAAEAIAAYVELNEWQIGEIEAGLAELEAGQALTQDEAEARYTALLQQR